MVSRLRLFRNQLTVLGAVARSKHPMSVQEYSDATGIGAGVVGSILRQLEQAGAVESPDYNSAGRRQRFFIGEANAEVLAEAIGGLRDELLNLTGDDTVIGDHVAEPSAGEPSSVLEELSHDKTGVPALVATLSALWNGNEIDPREVQRRTGFVTALQVLEKLRRFDLITLRLLIDPETWPATRAFLSEMADAFKTIESEGESSGGAATIERGAPVDGGLVLTPQRLFALREVALHGGEITARGISNNLKIKYLVAHDLVRHLRNAGLVISIAGAYSLTPQGLDFVAQRFAEIQPRLSGLLEASESVPVRVESKK